MVFCILLFDFNQYCFAQVVAFPSLTPQVYTESVIPGTTNATLKASAWINEGKAMKINTWFQWWIQGSGARTTTDKKFLNINKNLGFNEIIPFDSSKAYCFIPYAQLVDSNQNPVSDIGKGTELCFPKMPWVQTLLPATIKETSAYFRGKITSFQGMSGAIGFFRRWYQKTPTQVKQDGYQFIPKPLNADSKEFGWFYSDFDTAKNGNYCYQACAKDLPANARVNCDQEICFPETGGQEQDYFKVTKTAQALTDPKDCQQAKITIDIYCQGEQTISTRPDLDVVLLIDKSGTMKGIALDKTKQAIIEFINKLDKGKDKVALVSFADWGKIENTSGLTNNFDEVIVATKALKIAGNSTNLGDGFKKANELFAKQGRANVKKKIIVITDGIVNANQNGEAPDSMSYPEADNIYSNYAIAQANIAKNTHKAEIYVIRYSEKNIDQAHVKAAAFSKQVLQKIASPGQYYEAPTPEAIVQLFAQIVFSLTKTVVEFTVCKDMKVTDILTDNAQLIKVIDPPATSVNGKTIIWNLGNVSGHRRIELIVKYGNALPQLAEKYPDSKVEFVDMEGNKQTKELPEVMVKDLIPCGDPCVPSKKVMITGKVFFQKDLSDAIQDPTNIPGDGAMTLYNHGCLPVHMPSFSAYTFSYLHWVSAGDLNGYDTLIILPNSCTTEETIGDWSVIDKFIKDGGKAIIYDSGCSKFHVYDLDLFYDELTKKFDSGLTYKEGASIKIVDENILSKSDPSSPYYIDASQLGMFDKYMIRSSGGLSKYGFGTQRIMPYVAGEYCADMEMINSAKDPSYVRAFSKPKTYGKGLVIWNGIPRLKGASARSMSSGPDDNEKYDCSYNAGTATPQENTAKMLLLELQAKWDREGIQDCELKCNVPIPKLKESDPNFSSFGTVYLGIRDPQDIVQMAGWSLSDKGVKFNAVLKNVPMNKKYDVWFEVKPTKNLNGQGLVRVGFQNIGPGAFGYITKDFSLSPNQCVRAAAKVDNATHYTRFLCYQKSP